MLIWWLKSTGCFFFVQGSVIKNHSSSLQPSEHILVTGYIIFVLVHFFLGKFPKENNIQKRKCILQHECLQWFKKLIYNYKYNKGISLNVAQGLLGKQRCYCVHTVKSKKEKKERESLHQSDRFKEVHVFVSAIQANIQYVSVYYPKVYHCYVSKFIYKDVLL